MTEVGKEFSSYRDSHKADDKGRTYDEYYSGQAWARFLWERERIVLQRCLDEFFLGRDIHLLDFACGTGRITSFLEERVTTSVGVDVSESMLGVARGKLNTTKLIHADLTENNVLVGRKFNLITSFRFFLNAEPALRASALNALAPLLTDDGYLIINNHGNLSSPIVFATFLYNRLRGDNTRFMFLSQIRQVVADAGFEIVAVYPVGVLSIPRFVLPLSWNNWADNFFLRHSSLSFFAQSPIIVCRLRSAQRVESR